MKKLLVGALLSLGYFAHANVVDQLDLEYLRDSYPYVSVIAARVEAGKLVCGLSVRCKNADHTGCNVLFKEVSSEGVGSFGDGDAKVTQTNGNLITLDEKNDDIRRPDPGLPMPTLHFVHYYKYIVESDSASTYKLTIKRNSKMGIIPLGKSSDLICTGMTIL